jgi:peptidyl-prolyl cis-trans isomerase D
MLRGIRKASSNWLGRAVMGVVMGMLALSFVVWGIADIFRGFGRSTVAKVGDTEISIDLFRQTYTDRLQQLGRQFGRPITPEQARSLGLDRQLLSEMLAQAAVDERARQMRLAVADSEIARRITSDPTFQTTTGQFDRVRFEQLLRNAGFTEQRFVDEQKRNTIRRQIVETVSGGLTVPKTWIDAINRFQNEQRSIEYVALGSAQAGDIPQPTAEQLQKYFDERKLLFRAPEYRKIVVADVTPAELAKSVELSDDDIKKAFEDRRSRYVTPERRHVEQIVFPNMQEAQAASERIKQGTTFAQLAAERNLKDKDIDLGTVVKTGMIDKTVADAAFALKDGEVSEPVEGRFGAAIVTVLKIEPEESKSFAEVAPELRKDLALDRAKAEVNDIHDKIEDERAGGTSLEETAGKLKLPLRTYETIDRSGRGPDGKQVPNLPEGADVISAAFASDVGVDNEPLQAQGGGYIWYDVASIAPSHDRTLDEVKDQVEQRWRDDEIATRLKAKVADLTDKLKNNGAAFADLAAADGLKLEKAENLQRGKPSQALPAKLINVVFTTAKDGYGSTDGDKPTDWYVFRVTDVTIPTLDPASAEAKRIDDAVKRQLSDDMFAEYIGQVETELGVSVNQAGLAQALGTSAPEEN